MKLFLHTERLHLIPVNHKDFELFQHLCHHPFIRKYLLDDTLLPDDDLAGFIADSDRTFAEADYGLWLINIGDTGENIGFVGLRTFFDESQPQLIYALLPEYTGQGYATEASRKIIEYAFKKLGYDYLGAACDAPNQDSVRVLERLGMEQVQEVEIDGKDTLFFRLDRAEKI